MSADKISAKSLEYVLCLVRDYHELVKQATTYLWDFYYYYYSLAVSAIKGLKNSKCIPGKSAL